MKDYLNCVTNLFRLVEIGHHFLFLKDNERRIIFYEDNIKNCSVVVHNYTCYFRYMSFVSHLTISYFVIINSGYLIYDNLYGYHNNISSFPYNVLFLGYYSINEIYPKYFYTISRFFFYFLIFNIFLTRFSPLPLLCSILSC